MFCPNPHCPNYRKQVRDGARFCTVCGTALDDAPAPRNSCPNPYCPNHGAPMPEGARFCAVCGTALAEGPVQRTPPSEPETPGDRQPPEPEPRRRRKAPLVAAVVVALLLVGAGLAFGFWRSGGTTEEASSTVEAGSAGEEASAETASSEPVLTSSSTYYVDEDGNEELYEYVTYHGNGSVASLKQDVTVLDAILGIGSAYSTDSYTYSYDEAGDLQSMVLEYAYSISTTDDDGTVHNVSVAAIETDAYEYTYDEAGAVTDFALTILSVSKWVYSCDDACDEHEDVTETVSLTYQCSILYDDDGYPCSIGIAYTDSTDETCSITATLETDDNGYVTLVALSSEEERFDGLLLQYEYDSQGNVTKIEGDRGGNSTYGVLESVMSALPTTRACIADYWTYVYDLCDYVCYEYDDQGSQTGVYFYGDGATGQVDDGSYARVYSYDYEFDSDGNVVKRTASDVDVALAEGWGDSLDTGLYDIVTIYEYE